MNIELTPREREMLAAFAEKQHDGAKDNIGTMTPIHVVERIRKEYVESEEGDAWLWTDDYDWKTFDSFDEMLNHARKATQKEYPPYEEVEYEEVDDVWIESEKTYCKAYGIKAYPCKMVQYTEPVAFFFIRDEAVKYKEGYQAHNCADCRIYTYGLGYSNNGDLPVFRALLMRMGETINAEEEAKQPPKGTRCSICGEKFDGHGHNAAPVNNGRCCDKCNYTVVAPARIKEASNES